MDSTYHRERDREKYDRDRDQEAVALARLISGFVNRGGIAKTLVEELLRDHRTLQQSLMREVIVPYLVGMSRNSSDGRNEQSVALAKTLVAAGDLDTAHLSFI